MFGLDERPVKELADGELSDQLVDIQAQIDRLEARKLEVAGEWDTRALWAFDGFAKAPQWLVKRTGMPRGDARSIMWLARRLRRDMPLTRDAVRAGALSPAKARVLASAINERTEETFAEHEQVLVEQAASLSVGDLQRAVNHWKQMADQDGPVPAQERQRERRSLFFHRLPDGTWKIDGLLDAESGAIVDNELRRITSILWRSENADALDGEHQPRTSPQRRADALVEIFRRSSSANSHTPGAQPLLFVRIDMETLLGGEGESTLVDSETPIPAETARRLACDSSLARLVMDADGERLDMGRAVRTATVNQKRALIERDGPVCVVPGCDIPHDFCQAHHLVWWERGGLTDLANMAMVCSRHHHMFHEGRWALTREPGGKFVAHRPPPRC